MSDHDAEDDDNVRTRGRRRFVIAVVSLAALVILGGTIFAITTQTSGESPRTSRSNEPDPTASSSASPSPSPSITESNGDEALQPDPTFGEPVADDVPVGKPGVFPDGVTANVASVTPFDATGSGVGEISGPAVRVKIDLVNGSGTTLDLNGITVNAYYGTARTPASSYSSDSASVPFSGELAVGGSASGTYSFAVGADNTDSVVITVSSRAGTPIVVFTS